MCSSITGFWRVNGQNVTVKHKSHLCVNRNVFSYDIAVVIHLLMKQASIFWLLTGPVTVNKPKMPGRGQPRIKNVSQCRFYTTYLLKTSYQQNRIESRVGVYQFSQIRSIT